MQHETPTMRLTVKEKEAQEDYDKPEICLERTYS